MEDGQDESIVSQQSQNYEYRLPKSHIVWGEEKLIRFSKNGEKIAEFSKEEIKSVKVAHPFDPAAIVLAIGAGVIASICCYYIESPGWRWSLTVILALMSLLFFFAVKKNLIQIELKDTSVSFEFSDLPEDAEAFVLSVKRKLSL